MSENVLVSFGLSPYEHARMLRYPDCSAVTSMQIDGGALLTLEAQTYIDRRPTTSFLEVELPRETAEDTYAFLRVHDKVRQICGPEVTHTNCHIAAGTARGWIESGAVRPGLIEDYRLDEDEIERLRPKDFNNLTPGEVYAFASNKWRGFSQLSPAHSIIQLPVGNLHFSQLGWRGNPYIGGLRGAMDYHRANEQEFYRIVQKPRDIDSDRWRQEAMALHGYTAMKWNEILAKYERVESAVRHVGSIPTQRTTSPM